MRRGSSVARRRDVAGIAGKLHAVFGGAERRGADAFAGRQYRPREAPAVDARADGAAEPRSHIAEVAGLALIDVFGDAARKHHAVDAAELVDRVGQIKMRDVVRHRPRCDRGDQRVRHHVGDLLQIFAGGRVAAVPGKSGALGVMLSRRIEPHDLAVLDDLQPAADMDRRGRDHFAVVEQAELGRAAADVDIEDALALVARHPRGAGTVSRQHRLHVVAGGGGDEFAALLGQDLGDALGVVAPERLAGEDDDAGIDACRARDRLRHRHRR